MFTFDTKSIVCFLVDQYLDRRDYSVKRTEKGYSAKGISISFPVFVADYNWEKNNGNIEERAWVNIIFMRNVSVFYRVSEDMKYPLEDIHEYKNSSNHDSCWRTDGLHFLVDLYFKLCEKVNPKKPPIELHSTEFASKIRIEKNLLVEYNYEDDGYHIKLNSLKIVKE